MNRIIDKYFPNDITDIVIDLMTTPFLKIIDKDDICGWTSIFDEDSLPDRGYTFQYFNGTEFSGFDVSYYVTSEDIEEFTLKIKRNERAIWYIRNDESIHCINYYPESGSYVHQSYCPANDFVGGGMKLKLTKKYRLELLNVLEIWVKNIKSSDNRL